MKKIIQTDPTRKKLGDRILDRLEEIGRSANDVSQAAGFSADLIRNILKSEAAGKEHHPRMDTLVALAMELNTSVEYLTGAPVMHQDMHIDSSDIMIDPPRQRMVKLRGYVGAGSQAHYYNLADDEFEEVPAMEGASDQSIAVEIRGKSWGPLMDGWVVHYEDVRTPITDDMLGKICVVGLADDRILLKKIKRERDGSYTLLSNSNEEPIRDAMIDWAAEVIGFKPR